MPFLERGRLVAEESHVADRVEGAKQAVFELKPVGVERKPRNEAELLYFLRCILGTLAGCHQLGWAIVDLRWGNIISTSAAGDSWHVIDAAEHAVRIGQPLPHNIHLPPGIVGGSAASMEVDRKQLSLMLSDDMRAWLTGGGASRLRQQFLTKLDSEGCTFAELLNHSLMQQVSVS